MKSERITHSIERDERIDPLVEMLAAASDRVRRSGADSILGGGWLGHPLHPALTDLPIGFWTSSALLDAVGGERGRRLSQQLILAGLLCVPVTMASGLTDFGAIESRSTRRIGSVHAAGNVLATLAYARSWQRRRAHAHGSGIAWAVAGATIATFTAFLGGHLAFGRGS